MTGAAVGVRVCAGTYADRVGASYRAAGTSRRRLVASPRTVLALIAVLALLMPTAATAQSAGGPLRVWLALGLAGAGVQGLDAGIGGTAELTGQWREHHASLRMLGLADFAGFPDSSSDDSASEFGLTYGRWSPRSYGYTAMAVGLAMVQVRGVDPPPDDTGITVGIPLTAEAGVQTTFIGLSVQAFANLNAEASWAGVAGRILLGWMP